MWIPKIFGKRCVATVHGLDWQREKWGHGFASKYIKFGERVMVKCADEIIVLSESAREYFKNTYNRETVLIHNGIEKPVKKEAEKIKISAQNYVKENFTKQIMCDKTIAVYQELMQK